MKKFVGSFNRKSITGLKSFFKNEVGTIAYLTAGMAVPVMLAAGVAIDGIRLNRQQSSFDAALDSAALAVATNTRASVLGLSTAQIAVREVELAALASTYINKNFFSDSTQPPPVVTVKITGRDIKVSARVGFKAGLLGLASAKYATLNDSATVTLAMRPIELVMVMDTTGSMGVTYMNESKAASRKLLNTLYGGTKEAVPESEFIRTALVPFAAAVRLNQNAFDFNINWIDRTGQNPLSNIHFARPPGNTDLPLNNFTAWSALRSDASTPMVWNGCVGGRMQSNITGGTFIPTDAAPVGSLDPVNPSLFPAYFSPDDVTKVTSVSGYAPASPSNEYIGNPSSLSSTPSATGFETSGYGKSNDYKGTSSWPLRFRNQLKYQGKIIGTEAQGGDGPWSGCSKSPIVPLTYKRANVEDGITAMVSSGNTNVAEGLAWGWRVMSPTEPFTQVEGTAAIPSAPISGYGDARWQKIMVLMTDGENDLGSGFNYTQTRYSSYGLPIDPIANNRFNSTSQTASSATAKIDADVVKFCNDIKAQGIKIYAVAFRINTPSITTRLKNCATAPEYYKRAADGVELAAFFDHIGQDVLNKSIYVSN